MRYKAPQRLLLLHSCFLLVNMAFEGRQIRVRVEFYSQAAKSAFSSRLEYIRSLLTPPGLRSLDNHSLLSAMFDLVEGSVPSFFPGVTRAPASHLPGSSCTPANLASTSLAYTDRPAVVQSFNSNAGKCKFAYLQISFWND